MKSRQLKTKVVMIAGVVALVGGALSVIGISSHKPSANGGPAVVATVDGKQITAKIYRMYLKNGVDALGLNNKSDEGRRKIEQLKEGIVAELIDRSLIEAEVIRRDLPVPEKTLTEAYERTVAEMGGRDGYRAYLSEHEMTDEEFRETVKQEVYGQILRAELDREVTVSDREVEEFFNKERNNSTLSDLFREPEQVRARHILIAARRSQIASDLQANEGLSKSDLDRRVTAEMAKRRDRAADILNKLRHGASFQRLAAEYSEDAGTKNRGGDLGLFARNTHTSRFDEAAFALKPGQFSDIVETEYGYHILQVIEHTPERARSLAEARTSIEQKLLANKRAAHLNEWLENRRREAVIHIDPFYDSAQLHASDNAGTQPRKELTK